MASFLFSLGTFLYIIIAIIIFVILTIVMLNGFARIIKRDTMFELDPLHYVGYFFTGLLLFGYWLYTFSQCPCEWAFSPLGQIWSVAFFWIPIFALVGTLPGQIYKNRTMRSMANSIDYIASHEISRESQAIETIIKSCADILLRIDKGARSLRDNDVPQSIVKDYCSAAHSAMYALLIMSRRCSAALKLQGNDSNPEGDARYRYYMKMESFQEVIRSASDSIVSLSLSDDISQEINESKRQIEALNSSCREIFS